MKMEIRYMIHRINPFSLIMGRVKSVTFSQSTFDNSAVTGVLPF